MFDLGWSEMAVIVMVALVVIGPKDLPRVAREIGKWTSKARSMARDFQRSLDDMAREADLQDIKAELDKATSGSGSIGKKIESFIDPDGDLHKAFDPNQPSPTRAAAVTPTLPEPPVSTELAAPEPTLPLAPEPAREPVASAEVEAVTTATAVEPKQDRG